MSGIHQFVPMLHRRDAVGEHTRVLRDLLVAAGITSRIYTEIPDPETADETLPYRQYESDAEPGDVLVYQVATRSEMAGWLVKRQEKLVLNYHSITPPEYFAPWNNSIARLQVGAIGELSVLAPRAALGIGVSAFDVDELQRAGCVNTRVIPVDNLRSPPVPADPSVLELLATRSAGRGPWWLSVGRLAPNKCHQDTIAALFVARENGSPGPTSPSSARRPSRPMQLHCSATPGCWGWLMRSSSSVGSPRARSRLGTYQPMSWSWCPSTRDSACPCWRPWLTACL